VTTRISIFIPVYNDAQWLPGAIDSVLAQDHADWEIVVGDNVSDDDVARVVEGYADERIRYHRWTTHVPIDENFNRTALLCRYPWVQLLCADDRLRTGCLTAMVGAIERHPADAARLAMVLTACRRVDEHGNSADHVWYGTKRPFRVTSGTYNAADWFSIHLRDGHPPWNVGSVAIAHAVIEESGGFFRPEVGLSADVELYLRASAYGTVAYIDEPLLDFMVRSDADSAVRLWENRTAGDDQTPVERALLAGLNVHRHRRQVAPVERRGVAVAIARSHLQRAAQHRVLPDGLGRLGAWRDIRLAWRWSPRTVLNPYWAAYSLAAVLAPRSLLDRVKRRLSSRPR
jgi:glycosyltransferase involved in cell wall biosynthesis